MSVLDKLALIDQKHAEFEQKLDADAQKLLERYDEMENKKAKVFDRRNQVLDARAKGGLGLTTAQVKSLRDRFGVSADVFV